MKKEPRVLELDNLSYSEMISFQKKGYYKYTGRNITGEKTYYLFKPFFRESARHGILVYEVAKHLRTRVHKVSEYLSRNPDIVFEICGSMWAVEIETGKVLQRNKEQFYEKVFRLKRDYGDKWFFIITNRNTLKNYQPYGKTFTRRNLISKIDKIIRKECDDYY